MRTNLETIASAGKPPLFPSVHADREAFPESWMQSLRDHATDDSVVFRDLDASNAYLDAIYRCGTQAQRMLVLTALEERIEGGDTEAAETLRGFACLDIGQPDERFDMLYLLRELGQIAPGESVRVWDGQQMRDVKLIGTRILREPRPHDLSARCSLAVERIMEGDPDRADDLIEGLVERSEFYIQDAFSLFGTIAMQHRARGEHDAADQMLAHLEGLVESDDDTPLLEEAKLLQRLATRAAAPGS